MNTELDTSATQTTSNRQLAAARIEGYWRALRIVNMAAGINPKEAVDKVRGDIGKLRNHAVVLGELIAAARK